MLAWEDVVATWRLGRRLPGFLGRRLTAEAAHRIAARWRVEREAAWLALVHEGIYRNPASPYLPLLRAAGCEQGDLEGMVRRDGIERVLASLAGHGVYLSVDEYKGRVPAVRGGVRVEITPLALRTPGVVACLLSQSGGSRGARTPIPLDLTFLRDQATALRLYLDAVGGAGWRHAVWSGPGGAVAASLTLVSAGTRLERWFAQPELLPTGVHPRYRWGGRFLRWGSWLRASGLPAYTEAPLEDPLPVVRWMADVLRGGGTPSLFGYASAGVRLAHAAAEAGVDLRGARIEMSGEPLTPARLAVIRRSGADALVRYGSAETGPIGYGCLSPGAPDDIHVVSDQYAVIQRDEPAPPAVAPGELLVTSLRPSTPFLFLNVSLGDRAILTVRACGCPPARLGWSPHLHTVLSREKAEAGSLRLEPSALARVLEETLPARFGGVPTHYQLVAERPARGPARLRLLVHPAAGAASLSDAAAAFREFLGHPGSLAELDVSAERRPPFRTPSGKVLHLHVEPAA